MKCFWLTILSPIPALGIDPDVIRYTDTARAFEGFRFVSNSAFFHISPTSVWASAVTTKAASPIESLCLAFNNDEGLPECNKRLYEGIHAPLLARSLDSLCATGAFDRNIEYGFSQSEREIDLFKELCEKHECEDVDYTDNWYSAYSIANGDVIGISATNDASKLESAIVEVDSSDASLARRLKLILNSADLYGQHRGRDLALDKDGAYILADGVYYIMHSALQESHDFDRAVQFTANRHLNSFRHAPSSSEIKNSQLSLLIVPTSEERKKKRGPGHENFVMSLTKLVSYTRDSSLNLTNILFNTVYTLGIVEEMIRNSLEFEPATAALLWKSLITAKTDSAHAHKYLVQNELLLDASDVEVKGLGYAYLDYSSLFESFPDLDFYQSALHMPNRLCAIVVALNPFDRKELEVAGAAVSALISQAGEDNCRFLFYATHKRTPLLSKLITNTFYYSSKKRVALRSGITDFIALLLEILDKTDLDKKDLNDTKQSELVKIYKNEIIDMVEDAHSSLNFESILGSESIIWVNGVGYFISSSQKDIESSVIMNVVSPAVLEEIAVSRDSSFKSNAHYVSKRLSRWLSDKNTVKRYSGTHNINLNVLEFDKESGSLSYRSFTEKSRESVKKALAAIRNPWLDQYSSYNELLPLSSAKILTCATEIHSSSVNISGKPHHLVWINIAMANSGTINDLIDIEFIKGTLEKKFSGYGIRMKVILSISFQGRICYPIDLNLVTEDSLACVMDAHILLSQGYKSFVSLNGLYAYLDADLLNLRTISDTLLAKISYLINLQTAFINSNPEVAQLYVQCLEELAASSKPFALDTAISYTCGQIFNTLVYMKLSSPASEVETPSYVSQLKAHPSDKGIPLIIVDSGIDSVLRSSLVELVLYISENFKNLVDVIVLPNSEIPSTHKVKLIAEAPYMVRFDPTYQKDHSVVVKEDEAIRIIGNAEYFLPITEYDGVHKSARIQVIGHMRFELKRSTMIRNEDELFTPVYILICEPSNLCNTYTSYDSYYAPFHRSYFELSIPRSGSYTLTIVTAYQTPLKSYSVEIVDSFTRLDIVDGPWSINLSVNVTDRMFEPDISEEYYGNSIRTALSLGSSDEGLQRYHGSIGGKDKRVVPSVKDKLHVFVVGDKEQYVNYLPKMIRSLTRHAKLPVHLYVLDGIAARSTLTGEDGNSVDVTYVKLSWPAWTTQPTKVNTMLDISRVMLLDLIFKSIDIDELFVIPADVIFTGTLEDMHHPILSDYIVSAAPICGGLPAPKNSYNDETPFSSRFWKEFLGGRQYYSSHVLRVNLAKYKIGLVGHYLRSIYQSELSGIVNSDDPADALLNLAQKVMEITSLPRHYVLCNDTCFKPADSVFLSTCDRNMLPEVKRARFNELYAELLKIQRNEL